MLVEHGFTRATLDDGTEYTFTPSLGRVARLGSPAEIVECFGRLHGAGAATAAREVLAVFADQDDIRQLIGALVLPESAAPYVDPGAMSEREQIVLARHLMRHAICGAARPDAEEREPRGEYAAEFRVSEHLSAARVHLGLTEHEAEACSMTQLQQLFDTKFPSEEERKRRNAPSLAELEATERDVAAADARRRELIGA